MKWEEIEKRFDGEWVLIECIKVDSDTFRVSEGHVLYHSADIGRVYSKLLEIKPSQRYLKFVGAGSEPAPT